MNPEWALRIQALRYKTLIRLPGGTMNFTLLPVALAALMLFFAECHSSRNRASTWLPLRRLSRTRPGMAEGIVGWMRYGLSARNDL